jgi:tRNA/tmRNA/rRNA uracil-C5-methylase (TrmA/RlmC/RlmD family)
VGIDNVESAVRDAAANAELNGVTNAVWVCGPAEKVIDRVLEVRRVELGSLGWQWVLGGAAATCK